MRRMFTLTRCRLLLIGSLGVAMFLAWFGLWVRVLPVKPRVVIRPGQGIGHFYLGFDGKTIITQTAEWRAPPKGDVSIWNVVTGEELQRYSASSFRVIQGNDDTVTLIDRARSERLWAFLDSHPYAPVFATPDGHSLAGSYSNDGGMTEQIAVWDVEEDRQRYVLPNPMKGPVGFSPNGRLLAYVRQDGQSLLLALADVVTGSDIALLDDCEWVPSKVYFSSDGRLLAASYSPGLGGTNRSRIKVWSVETRQVAATLEDAFRIQPGCAFSPDSHYLACFHVVSGEQTTRHGVWSTRTWKEHLPVSPWNGELSDHEGLAFLANSNRLAITRRRVHREEEGLTATIDRVFNTSWAENYCVTDIAVIDAESGRTVSRGTYKGSLMVSSGGFVYEGDPVFNRQAELRLYDLPPRRPINLYLLLSTLPALLFTALLWWRVR